MTVEWRGKPVWIVRRTPEQLAALPKLDPQLADPEVEAQSRRADARLRAQRGPLASSPSILVVVGICTHLGCSPTDKFMPGAQPSLPDDWAGGFLCPCHGSTFDMAGRVFKNKPAPDNLEVPPHMYLSDSRLLIGEDEEGLSALPRHLQRASSMAEFKHAPAGAGAGQKLLTWVDNRFPLTKLYKEHMSRVLRAEELQLLVRLRLAGDCWCW